MEKADSSSSNTFRSAPDHIPARMLNQFAYCPRLAFIEWVNGEFEQNVFTVEGKQLHRRVDAREDPLPDADSDVDADGDEEPPGRSRSVMLSSDRVGAIARMDIVETEGRVATPVDYKRSLYLDADGGLPEGDCVQLCVQGLILRDHGFQCDQGVLYYADVRRRHTVAFNDHMVAITERMLEELREVAESGQMPAPLLDSPKCDGCSLVGVCLPDETNLLVTGKSCSVRRLIPANDNALPMYVTVSGAKVRKSGDTLRVTQPDTPGYDEARLIDVSRLSLFGNVQLTTQALRELCHRGIPITYHSTGGWFYGITTGPSHKNVALRQQQYAAAAEPVRSLQLARAFVKGKILNCRTMLMRNHSDPPDHVLRSLKELAAKTDEFASAESPLGLEGTAARDYFSCFSGMLKPPDGDLSTFSFTQRNRRPPRDEVNALLSFAYSLLTKELVVAALAVGFDPFLGFYHRPRYGRPSLALDLMEEFRPIVADSIVITAVNNGMVKRHDFVRGAGSVNLKPAARRRFIGAFTKRMDQQIRHPVFRYRISYSRILEVQARLLGRFLTGELDAYPSFQTR